MKRSIRRSALSIVVLLGLTGIAQAQEFKNMELTPFVAGTAHTKNQFEIGFPQTITPIKGEFLLDDAIRGGMRLNIHTTGHWGQEFYFGYEPNRAHFVRKTSPQQNQELAIRVYNFGLNAMYYLREEEDLPIRPFISAGIGGILYQPTADARQIANDPLRANLPGFESSAEVAINVGVGFKKNLTKMLGVRMDVRGYVSRNPKFGLPRSSSDPSAAVFPASGSIENMEASVGLIIKLKK